VLEGDFIKYIFNLCIILCLILNIESCSVNNVAELKENNISQDIIEQEKNIEIPSTEEIIETLCSDSFGGRLVGSEGNQKAENYILEIDKKLKLKPLFDEKYYESYTQEVFKTYGFSNDDGKPENKEIQNLVGVIKGSDSTKAVVISAHFDHIGYQDGNIIRGALDNASGVATLVRIAETLKKQSKNKTFSQDIIIAFFNSEEEGQQGSKAFASEIKSKYSSLYDINIDCVGGKKAGKISLNNKSKISDRLTEAMKETFKNNNMVFSDIQLKDGTSDQKRFEDSGIPNIYIGQDNLKPYIHNSNDTPDTLDYDEINKVADVLSDFIQVNDGKTFND
jgi:hypothetical protein